MNRLTRFRLLTSNKRIIEFNNNNINNFNNNNTNNVVIKRYCNLNSGIYNRINEKYYAYGLNVQQRRSITNYIKNFFSKVCRLIYLFIFSK